MTADALLQPAVHEREIAGTPLVWRDARDPDDDAPVVYLHGVPTDGDDFLPFLARTGGLAPDLPGFGRSGKSSAFPYSIDGYAELLGWWLDELGVERCRMVVHDWGAVGLAFAQRAPERVERLVVIDAIPLLPGYEWHRWARAWRRPLLGELAMGATSRRLLRRALREAVADADAARALADRAWQRFDHGTQRAILKLYRSAPPDALARAGASLEDVGCPALVVWGAADPYLPERFAHAYGAALGAGDAAVEVVAGAGHWPWLDRPEVVERVAGFLLEG